MSVETLILLALFVLVPLLQRLLAQARERNRPTPQPAQRAPSSAPRSEAPAAACAHARDPAAADVGDRPVRHAPGCTRARSRHAAHGGVEPSPTHKTNRGVSAAPHPSRPASRHHGRGDPRALSSGRSPLLRRGPLMADAAAGQPLDSGCRDDERALPDRTDTPALCQTDVSSHPRTE